MQVALQAGATRLGGLHRRLQRQRLAALLCRAGRLALGRGARVALRMLRRRQLLAVLARRLQLRIQVGIRLAQVAGGGRWLRMGRMSQYARHVQASV